MSTQDTIAELMPLAEYVEPSTSTNFHVSIEVGQSAETIRRALAAIGVKATVTYATHERDGVMMTDRMSSFTWDSQTGNLDIDDPDAEDCDPKHVNYRQLTPEQQGWFVDRVVDRMNHARGEADMDLRGINRLGPPVAVTPCV